MRIMVVVVWMTAKLQIALDLLELTKAVEIATRVVSAVKCDNIWIEVGTPLLKSWGKIAIKALKNITDCFLVADTKIMDVPEIEGATVFGAGADAYTILAVADDEVVKDGVRYAREKDKTVIIDLINHPNPLNRAVKLAEYGADVLLYHVGISVQKARGISAKDLKNEIAELRKLVPVKIAVAGGLKPGDVRELVELGVDVVVVGGAVTKSPEPENVVKQLLMEIGYKLE
ncbi:MAG: orotidine 5'-phosphate decarboxylase / HUMPS family protein [Thermosphaera sp.]